MLNPATKNWNDYPIMLSVPQVAEILRMGKWSAYLLAHREDFPAVRIGKHKIRVNRDELKVWIEKQKGTIEYEQCS